MSRASAKLRRSEGSYFHWCPACKEMHPLPDKWHFDGDVNAPSFTPSFRHTISRGEDPDRICHYFLTAGQLKFCGDCTHEMANQVVALPDLPEGMY